jgi:hypothetical protein
VLKILGHATISTTIDVYVKTQADQIRRSVARYDTAIYDALVDQCQGSLGRLERP